MNKSQNWIPKKIHMYRKSKKHLGGFPAFPLRHDATNESKQTALAWVADIWRGRINKQMITGNDPIEISNNPRGGFKVVSAEQRDNGGRAWKVITPDGDLVDMREDVFLPILLDRGLPSTKIIDAQFQWVQCGSQLKLIEVGSQIHKAAITEEEHNGKKEEKKMRTKQKAINEKELVVGNIYTFGDGTIKKLYFGKMKLKNCEVFTWIDARYNLISKGSDTFKAWGINIEYSKTCTAISLCTTQKPPQNFINDIDIYRSHIYKVTKMNSSWKAVVQRNEMFDRYHNPYYTGENEYAWFNDMFKDFHERKWID